MKVVWFDDRDEKDMEDALRWFYHRNCADSLMGFREFISRAAQEWRTDSKKKEDEDDPRK